MADSSMVDPRYRADPRGKAVDRATGCRTESGFAGRGRTVACATDGRSLMKIRMIRMTRPEDAARAFEAAWNATIYRDSALETELIDVVAIGDDAAVVHFWSRLTVGAAHPAGPHAVDTLILAVLARQADEWRIKALENVTLTNPRTGESVLRGDRGS
jgi:ketosteroid isomerase-like protein